MPKLKLQVATWFIKLQVQVRRKNLKKANDLMNIFLEQKKLYLGTRLPSFTPLGSMGLWYSLKAAPLSHSGPTLLPTIPCPTGPALEVGEETQQL